MNSRAAGFLWRVLVFLMVMPLPASAGTWADHFSGASLGSDWQGSRSAFSIENGTLHGQSASPLPPPQLNLIEVGHGWTNCTVECWVNVVTPNLRVCTKGALILRHSGSAGYVFALHEAMQTVEVYRLSDHQIFLSQPASLPLGTWHRARADLSGPVMSFFLDDRPVGAITDDRSPAGAVGLAVEDAEEVLFDDFRVTGELAGNVDTIEPPVIDRVQLQEGRVVVQFIVAPSFTYTLETAPSLSSHWDVLTNFTAKIFAAKAAFSEPVTNGPRLYRLDKMPCGCR